MKGAAWRVKTRVMHCLSLVMLALVAILIIALGLIALSMGRRMQTEAGLPAGRVVYADTGKWRELEKPLYSALHQLVGKPDYIVKQGKQTIPVEVKSANAPAAGPRRSHVLQLAAYCLLIEETYQHRPEFGIVKYADRTFEIDYTSALESTLLDVIDAMRDDLTSGRAARSHTEPARCARCGYRQACDERLSA